MKKILFYLTIPLRPGFWLMNESYNKEWDIKLKGLISDFKFTKISYYHANLGDECIWIANHPYASFIKYVKLNENVTEEYRPSRYTIYLAGKKLKKEKNVLRRVALKAI